ncbi:MAG: hypothetical protein ACI9T9_002332 [Oleiphilaceae bacterium]|jgi:hypothetical protein
MFRLRLIKESTYVKLLLLLNFLAAVLLTSQGVNARTITFESSTQRAALVELYTSEGCSSCPPAERWFSQLSNDERLWTQIFPVAFHVDYWDYLGWRDPFASPSFSLRQRKYERYGHTNNVATPGFVVDGKGWNGWFRGRSLPAIASVKNSGLAYAALKVELNEQDVGIHFTPHEKANNLKASFKVHVAILAFDIVISVKGGENRGRDLKHDFVVVGYQDSHLLQTDGDWLVNLKRPDTHPYDDYRQAAVIWISKGDDPRAIQVAGGWLPNQ